MILFSIAQTLHCTVREFGGSGSADFLIKVLLKFLHVSLK